MNEIHNKYARAHKICAHVKYVHYFFGKQRGCHFAFVETMSFQAPEFYRKMGFKIEFSRPGYAKNTIFHYLTKKRESKKPKN